MSLSTYLYNRQCRKQNRQPVYRQYDDIHSIFIVFESDYLERHTQIKQFIKELQHQGKEVTAWGYVDKKDPLTLVIRDFRVLGKRQFGLFHRPKKQVVEEISRGHYDLLIDLNTDPECLELRYMSLYVQADLKTGLACYDEPFQHDMLISLPEDEKDTAHLFDQILHFLKVIREGER